MSLITNHSSLTTVVIWLAAVLVACGVPGEPLPPLLEIPEPIRDLSTQQVGARLRLVFSRPQLTTEGTRVRFLDRIELHGVFLPGEASLTRFPEQAQLLATLRAAELPEGQAQVVYEFPMAASQLGAQAFFALKAINHKGRDAGFSNVSSVEIVELPEPPSDLQATLTQEAIRLSWKEAERSAFGGPAPQPEGYEVFRITAGAASAAEVVGTTASPSYEDRSFAFGQRYVYSVRAFFRRGESVAVTPHSPAAEIFAVDRFPPAAPQSVRAIAVPGAVELAWSPNPEKDLAGYNVYRSEGGAFVKLNADLLPIPLFRDSGATVGRNYRYHVKAVDREGNAGSPSEEVSATGE